MYKYRKFKGFGILGRIKQTGNEGAWNTAPFSFAHLFNDSLLSLKITIIYGLFLSGLSFTAIERTLEGEGIKVPGGGTRGTRWRSSSSCQRSMTNNITENFLSIGTTRYKLNFQN